MAQLKVRAEEPARAGEVGEQLRPIQVKEEGNRVKRVKAAPREGAAVQPFELLRRTGVSA